MALLFGPFFGGPYVFVMLLKGIFSCFFKGYLLLLAFLNGLLVDRESPQNSGGLHRVDQYWPVRDL